MNTRHVFLCAPLACFLVFAAGCGTDPASSTGANTGAGGSTATSSSSASSNSSGTAGAGAGGNGSGGMAGNGSGGMGGAVSGGMGGMGGMGGGGNGLAALSDVFDGNVLSSEWMVYRPEVLNISVNGGSLVLRLDQQALWYNASRGPLVYKFVSGNFKVTARVRVRKASNNANPPTNTVHLGGLMARDPQGEMPGAQENYVFIVAGFDENDLSVETKSTLNSMSMYEGPSWPSGDAELRLCRVGSMFYMYKRAIGGATFTLAKTYDRPTLPAKLQVGGNVYSVSAPDLVANFEEITFANAATEADCAAN